MAKILAGSKLNYKTTGTEYKELADVKTLPSLGGSINKEDAPPIANPLVTTRFSILQWSITIFTPVSPITRNG